VASFLRQALIGEAAPTMARRGRRLWRLRHQPEPAPAFDAGMRRNGVFVVMGHVADGMGQVWARTLAALPDARLALAEDEAATPLADLAAGERTMRLVVDCADAAAVGRALDAVAARWGRIDGVFLSTPFSDVDVTAPLALLGDDQRRRAQRTIVSPVHALAQASATRRIGFCCVQSSLSSTIGGVGLAAYAAAHSHAEVFVANIDREADADWYAIGWDALAVDAPAQTGRPGQGDFSLSPEQVWDATRRIIGGRLTGCHIVSRGDVDARRDQWLSPSPETGDDAHAASGRRRPDLETPFVAPRTPLETSVATILQDLLGLDRVGVDDGFFELGGHSLLAIRAIARLREAFPVEIGMRELLVDNPSAAAIARLIEAKLAEDADLADLVAEVSNLSEDEIEAALKEDAAE